MLTSYLPPNQAISVLMKKTVDSEGWIYGVRYIHVMQVKKVEWLGTVGVGWIRKYMITMTDGYNNVNVHFTTNLAERKKLYAFVEGKRKIIVKDSIVKMFSYNMIRT